MKNATRDRHHSKQSINLSFALGNLIVLAVLALPIACGYQPEKNQQAGDKTLGQEKLAISECCESGDVTGDGSNNILDVVGVVNCVMSNNCQNLSNSCAADFNGDGSYSVLDVVGLVNCVMGGNCGGPCADPDCSFIDECLEPFGSDFLGRHLPVPQGMALRIDDAPGGFGTLEEIGEELLDGVNLLAGISNPVASGGWLCGGTDASVTSINFSSTTLDINPQSNGKIKVTATIHGLVAGWHYALHGHFFCPAQSFSGTLSANNITLSAEVTLSVPNGNLSVSVGPPSFSYSGFNFNINNWPNWLEPDGAVESGVMGGIQGTLNSTFSNMIPGLIEDLLNDIEMPAEDFDLDGNTYQISADFSGNGITVEEDGVTFELDTMFTVDNWVKSEDYGSYIVQDFPTTFSNSHDVHFSLGDNHINKAVYALWGGGAFDKENIEFQEGDGEFGCDVKADVETLLAPRTYAVGNQSALDVIFDAVQIRAHCGSTELALVNVTMTTRIDMGTSNGEFTVAAAEPSFNAHVIYPDGMEGAFFEAVIDAYVDQEIEANLQNMFSNHPLPEMDGFEYTDFAVSTSDGHVNMGMNLNVASEDSGSGTDPSYSCCGGNFYNLLGQTLGNCSNMNAPVCGCTSGAISCPCQQCP